MIQVFVIRHIYYGKGKRMPTVQRMKYCPTCGAKTLHIQQRPNYLLHVVLTVLTAGLWLVPWLLFIGPSTPQCTACGGPDTIGDLVAQPGKVLENSRNAREAYEAHKAHKQAVKEAQSKARAERSAEREAARVEREKAKIKKYHDA
ncbi:hypothetical protein BMI86_13885 [Thioclava sp. DLFJ5-1]|uniref:hypothetical protein n=1 Tax=Thioclava sp. DLFJ5-1 TaxID=1915314 RepID=UPI0009CAEE2B|nr:hypothetical protein [Thioclava sp. DLFJ5-1]OOY19713.1 hypothetical protein BMI86_13885 [Thioclava sp. DLFJ5-1]